MSVREDDEEAKHRHCWQQIVGLENLLFDIDSSHQKIVCYSTSSLAVLVFHIPIYFLWCTNKKDHRFERAD